MDINILTLILDFEKCPDITLIKKIITEFRSNSININVLYCNITLLHIKQPYETMKYLLDNGGNPNIEGRYDLKPIHLQENYKTIKLLIDRGAQPNPKDSNNFNPLFWQKDPESTIYLLKYNEIYTGRILSIKSFKYRSPYIKMLIDGGYDPYSEINISVSPIFLQRNVETYRIIMDHVLNFDLQENLYDIAYETILFKPCINSKIINIHNSIFHKDDLYYFINHQNILGNSALFVQYLPENIIPLLENDADWTIKNNNGLNPIDYHLKRNSIEIAKIIIKFSSAKIIQRCWKKYRFDKTYIPPKYYNVKKRFLLNFIYLPPSQCHTFPGGIEYQTGLEDFTKLNIN